MRWIAGIAIFLLMAAAGGIADAMLWVDRGLRDMERKPTHHCFLPRDIARIWTGTYPADQQDLLVAQTLNFQMQAEERVSLTWHIRGTTIVLTYRTFWSDASRRAIFERLAARIRPCHYPPHLPLPPAGR